MGTVSVGASDDVCRRETIQRGEARPVRVEPEHSPTATGPTVFCRSIQYTVRHYQFGFRTGAVAVGPQRAGCEAKRMQDRESCAIRVDFEYRAISSAAALGRSSIKRAACQQQTALGECSVAIAVKHTRKGREIEKIRESSSIRTDRKNVS